MGIAQLCRVERAERMIQRARQADASPAQRLRARRRAKRCTSTANRPRRPTTSSAMESSPCSRRRARMTNNNNARALIRTASLSVNVFTAFTCAASHQLLDRTSQLPTLVRNLSSPRQPGSQQAASRLLPGRPGNKCNETMRGLQSTVESPAAPAAI